MLEEKAIGSHAIKCIGAKYTRSDVPPVFETDAIIITKKDVTTEVLCKYFSDGECTKGDRKKTAFCPYKL